MRPKGWALLDKQLESGYLVALLCVIDRRVTRVQCAAQFMQTKALRKEYNMSADAKLVELKLELPPAPKPAGVYKPALILGNRCLVSGHGPLQSDKTLIVGRVGADMTKEEGYAAARQTGLAILATLQQQLGSLDRIERVVKVLGMVQSAADFGEQPAVINGCSELFRDVFGEDHGIGTRSAIGLHALPGGIAVEIEAEFLLKD